MKTLGTMAIIAGLGLALTSCTDCKKSDFKYSVDQFADIEVLRYQIPDWDGLTLQQKEYIYHLCEAAKAGRDITWDQNFKEVIRQCALSPRPGQDGTWIVPDMIDAYIGLHEAGHAHSLEVWQDGELVGGLYGVLVGRVFFGESMFHAVPDASKAAVVEMCRRAEKMGIAMIDCQQTTQHMVRFGAIDISRKAFTIRLAELV